MGMAASQARFLGLTARKSNVEYQGQQINQQRTALSNESANLYNQMMDLSVPTPPSTSDYYTTKYTLDDSNFGGSSSYSIHNMTKLPGENRYSVSLEVTNVSTVGTSSALPVTSVYREKLDDSEDYNHYKTYINGAYVNYYKDDCSPYTTDTNTGKNTLSVSKNKIYKIDDTAKGLDLSGFDESVAAMKKERNNDGDSTNDIDDNTQYYFYMDNSGKYCYMTESDLAHITSEAFGDSTENNAYFENNYYTQITYATSKNEITYTDVNATVEKSNSTGRYSSIIIDDNDTYPTTLSGKTFSISTTTATDEDAYNDAFNDYEYQKSVYEQRVAELNAKTEVIQSQDQQLELRLDQLDTEQNAIKTEMEAVQKVISDNVEQTFKIFA